MKKTFLAVSLIAVLLASSLVARAEEMIWATGRILTPEGRALSGALVAVYNDSNKVVDYAKTDENGEYALALPRKVLHLDKKKQGFFTQVVGGVTRLVGGAAGFVANPLRAGVHAVTSSQASTILNPLAKGGIMAGGAVADQILFGIAPKPKKPDIKVLRKQPGFLVIKAVAPNSKDLISLSSVYWVQQEVFKAGGKQTKTLAVWLDPIQLEPAHSDEESKVTGEYLQFTRARLEPSIAVSGQRVRITARLKLPQEPTIYAVVVARNNSTGEKWELQPIGNGIYEGEMQISKKSPKDDQVISILAYAAKESNLERRRDVEGTLEKSGLWDPNRPFQYNPLMVVSRNRADIVLTVVSREQ